jgi:putative sulfotransferase
MALRRGYTAEEIVYPFGAPGARYGMQDELPWLLVTALSRMSDDPDAWFDATLEFARARPTAPLREHYRALFAWWTERAGRSGWLERSGSSIEYLGALHALFPEARFLHIHRDGPETALSMREHRLYRLAISFLYDLPPPGAAGARGSNAAMAALDADPDEADPISARLEQELPVETYGRYWSEQVERGLDAVQALSPGCYRAIRFEDLVARPETTLEEVADFLGLATGDWVREAAALVVRPPSARTPTLSRAERDRLRAACAPGMRRLGRDGGPSRDDSRRPM